MPEWLVAQVVPTTYVGLVGLVPICIGVNRLLSLNDAVSGGNRLARGDSKIVTVTLVTISNGDDNLSLCVPLFAIHAAAEIALSVVVFMVMTALWCRAGFALVNSHPFGTPARRWGTMLLPYVVIPK